MFLNEEMNNIKRIAKSLEESGFLIKGVSETIKNETKTKKKQKTKKTNKQKRKKKWRVSQNSCTLGVSLLGNLLTGKGTIRAGEDAIRAGQDL